MRTVYNGIVSGPEVSWHRESYKTKTMKLGESNMHKNAPLSLPYSGSPGLTRRVLGVVGAMGGAIALAILLRDEAAPLIFGLFVLLAMIGVAALFFAATGLLQFAGHSSAASTDPTKVYAENAGHGVAMTSPDGATVFANAAYYQLIGVSDDSPFSIETALVRQFGGSEPLFRLIRAARKGQEASEEFQALGAGRWLEASVRRVATSNEPGARDWLCLWEITDISSRKKREAHHAFRIRELHGLLDRLPAGVILAGADGRVNFMNATLRDWIGLGEQERDTHFALTAIFPGQFDDILDPEHEENGDQIDAVNFDIVKPDGTVLPVTAKLLRLFGEGQGSEGTLFGTILERYGQIDQKVIEGQINDLFNLLISAPIAVAAISKDGRMINCNPAFAKFTGMNQMSADANLFELVDKTTLEPLQYAVEKAAANKASITPVDISIKEAKRAGRLLLSSVPGAREKGIAALVFGIDTSEQRSLEEQIAQGQKMQAIGQLAGGIAHDFNNVLTAIIGFSDLLLANHRPSDPSFADIKKIKDNAIRAAGLVRHLLAFSRKQTLHPVVISLTNELADLMMLLDQLLGEKVKARVIHGRDLWFTKVDPTQFQQVIINLAVNARDAMPDGGELMIRTENISERESARLGHSVMEPGEYVLCEVKDTGTGIPPDVIDKIYEPFFSTKEVGKGTGLGLSTVYGIVKQTGGFIFAESEVGSGTVFRIYLPRCEEMPALPAGASADKPAKKEREAGKDLTGSATVLLVEDEDAVRSFAARALSTRGYKVLEASSGAHALEVMSEHQADVDIVVSDVVMPEMDGPTMLKHLRKTNPNLKIIFMSGYAEDAFRNGLSEDDASTFAFLPKPFSLKVLAEKVKDVLEQN